ncbi:MAG: succinylglutamate desuccinylase/aspartoacylase family protein [Planctomycetes bacterium]|nr:succinylglutamate desuccinylase/aspartoacylase family protein [Planctomycetota bacterium]
MSEDKTDFPIDMGSSPNSAEVVAYMKAFAKKHPGYAKMNKLGASTEGRIIYSMTMTDPKAAAKDKQHVIIVGGRHGNEESGRLIALKLMDYLVTAAGRKHLKKQKIVILPNGNPDGCERDIYHTPAGVNVAQDYQEKKPITETLAFLKAIEPLRPELMIDLHARGKTGCSTDMVLYPEAKSYTEDDNILHQLAHDMSVAGEKVGIPHLTHPLKWWMDGFCGVVSISYQDYKAISMLTETAESNTHCHSEKLRAKAGVARIAEALKWGNVRYPGMYAEGYPCQIIAGSYAKALVAVGGNAAARRKSRIDAWKNVEHMAWKSSGVVEDKSKKLIFAYSGKVLNHGLGIQMLSRHRRAPKSVTLNEKKLRVSETNGYVQWSARSGNAVLVNIPKVSRGDYEIQIEY